ncbi:MAG: DNA repair protein RadC [Candidatus Sericytochromatia bacterium]|nr:DNA repair protein RadC [Candidatus Tanganyikabacteria bacterium]
MSYQWPRERLSRLGAEALSDRELLAILLATGRPGASVLSLAADVAGRFPPPALLRVSLEELCRLPGIGTAKASRLLAALELGRRSLRPPGDRPVIRGAADAYAIVGPALGNLAEEQAVVLLLDARGGLIATPTIAVGGLAALGFEARQVFREAVRRDAAGLLLAHNHPTGDLRPSPADIETTRKLLEASEVVGIPVIDHLIVAPGGFTSLREATRLWAGRPAAETGR